MNKGSRDLGRGALCYRVAASDGDRLKVSNGGSRKGLLNPGGILGPGHCSAASGTCSPSRLPGFFVAFLSHRTQNPEAESGL